MLLLASPAAGVDEPSRAEPATGDAQAERAQAAEPARDSEQEVVPSILRIDGARSTSVGAPGRPVLAPEPPPEDEGGHGAR